jgi:hypothetical protein
MKIAKNKTAAIAIAILLTISMGASMMLVPTANAHSPAWQIPTQAFIVVVPNPVGVGQTTHVYLWLAEVFGAAGGTTAAVGTNGSTASASLLSNNYRFHNYKLTITDPNGTTTTQTFDVISDTTSSVFTKFTPDKVGTYTFNFSFPGQAYAQYEHYENSVLVNDTYLPSSASTTITVQQEPLVAPITSYPLPSAYWSHPIYGENTDWWAISSNWLGSAAGPPQGYGGTVFATLYRSDAVGPQTSHIMWTKPLQFGGVVGGNQYFEGGSYPSGAALGVAYYEGSSYQPRFTNPIIINGYLFYTDVISFTGSAGFFGSASGPTNCVDLRTGQVLWSRTDVPSLSFGYIFNLWNPDQHGVFPPILVAVNPITGNWQLYDAYTGGSLFNVTSIPSSTSMMVLIPTSPVSFVSFPNTVASSNIAGPNGEQLRYVIANAGTAANPQWYLAQWNMSKLWQYDVNPYTGGGSLSPSIINASNGVLIGTVPIPITGVTGTLPTGLGTAVPYGSALTVNANIPINSTTIGGGSGTAGNGITTYDWNVSLPWLNTMPAPYAAISAVTGQLVQPPAGANPVSIVAVKYGDVMLCRNGTLPTGFGATRTGYPQLPYTYFAVNLNASRGAIGSTRWMQTYNPPSGNLSLVQGPVDFQTRVFILNLQETMQWAGYSLDTGNLLWTTPSQTAWDYYGYPGTTTLPGTVAYGNLYCSSFGGICYCYNDLTGKLLWTYGNGGAGNSTNAGLTVFYGDYPTMIQSIANGVIYLATDEHTIPNPLYKGCLATAINATTGKEIWQLSLYPSEWSTPGSAWATADGFIACMNGLDNNIYSIGRGPSATTVQAPMTAITAGNSVVIQGTVMDISAGTKQTTQAADFPNGVPAVSDASMKDWMGYVYQQKPYPGNATGVEVTLDAVDPNGNFVHIGTPTSDASGTFGYAWTTPDVPGKYTVIATFAGSNSYWPSYTETTMVISEAAPTPSPPQYPVPIDYTMSIIAAAIAVIIAVAIATIILLLRKRP